MIHWIQIIPSSRYSMVIYPNSLQSWSDAEKFCLSLEQRFHQNFGGGKYRSNQISRCVTISVYLRQGRHSTITDRYKLINSHQMTYIVTFVHQIYANTPFLSYKQYTYRAISVIPRLFRCNPVNRAIPVIHRYCWDSLLNLHSKLC